ncbi:MAG: hypothetical protein K0Q51_368 [Rickettsiaceae bacterium]|jgi:hypothetical protein|nr:hypothetical protein [Rickettsiaceae bacterium]
MPKIAEQEKLIQNIIQESNKNNRSIESSFQETQDKLKTTIKDISGQNALAGFSEIIANLSKSVDLRNGISHEKVIDPETRQTILVRDARLQKEHEHKGFFRKHPENCPEAWAEVMAGFARGAVKLVEIAGNDSDRRNTINNANNTKIIGIFQKHYKEIQDIENNTQLKDLEKAYAKQVEAFQEDLVTCMKEMTLKIDGKVLDNKKEIKKALDSARSFANLEDEHHPVLTISGNFKAGEQDTSAITFAKPLTESNDLTKYSYQLDNSPTNKWFKELSPVNQKLVQAYKGKILDGKHILSSQLNFLPGLHNAYIEYRGLIDDKGALKEGGLTAEARMGTVAAFQVKDSKERLRITKDNLLDLESTLKEHGLGQVNLSILNNIGEQGGLTKKGIPALVEQAANELNKGRDNSRKIIVKQGAVNNLALFRQARNFKMHLKQSITMRQAQGSSNGRQEEALPPINVVSCKSGKDRTGLVCINNQIDSIVAQEGLDQNQKKVIAETLADSKHAQFLASSHGGTRGIHALITNSVYWQKLKNIGQYIGMHNPIQDIGIDDKLAPTKLAKLNKIREKSSFKKAIKGLKKGFRNLVNPKGKKTAMDSSNRRNSGFSRGPN